MSLVFFCAAIGCGGSGGSPDMAGSGSGNGGNSHGGGGGSGSGNGTGGTGGGNGGADLAGPATTVHGGSIADMATPASLPVILKNASVRMLPAYGYNLTFAVVDNAWSTFNGVSILRVDLLRLSWGADKVSFQLGCESSPWIDAKPTTGAVTINLQHSTSGTSSSGISLLCGTVDQNLTANGMQQAPSGTVHVAIDGVLTDATPFTAEADAPVL